MEAPVQIAIALVYPNDAGRAVDKDRVKGIAESMNEIGQRIPITVRPTTKVADGREIDAYEIVCGRHRYEAACRLGWNEIAAFVSNDDDLHCELWEIDENLMRAELSYADRAICVARRKEIYEILHPEAKHGSPTVSRQLGDTQKRAETDRFTADTAKATGQSERKVQRDAERGEKIDPDVLKAIKGGRWDKGVVLDILKKLTHAEQKQALFRVKSGASPSFQDAYDFIKGGTPAPKPTTPRIATTNEESVTQQYNSLVAAWNRAGPEAREMFREHIDTPVFDKTRAGAA